MRNRTHAAKLNFEAYPYKTFTLGCGVYDKRSELSIYYCCSELLQVLYQNINQKQPLILYCNNFLLQERCTTLEVITVSWVLQT